MKRLSFQSMICLIIMVMAGFSNAAHGQDFNGTWEGTLEAGVYSLTLVFHIEQNDQGVTFTWDSPDQGGFNLPATATITGNELDVDIPDYYAKYKGTLVGDTLDGVFTQGANMPLRLTRKAGDGDNNRRPQEAAIEADGNKPYHAEEVTFTNDGITFAGTLTLPNSGNNFPAVVLIAGSGPHDRNEEVFNHKPFLLLADALSRNGFAVLRYDERGVGATVGGDPFAPTEPLATDAMAALRYLKSRPEVDATRAGLMGHSEGGMIAIMNAAQHPDEVPFIVSLAGTGVDGVELGMQQVKLLSKAMGTEPDSADLRLNEELFKIIAAEKDSVTLRNKMIAFYQSHPEQLKDMGDKVTIDQLVDMTLITSCIFQYDPTENLKRVKCPMLAINGTLDAQVACEENLEAIKRLVPHATVKPYEGLNHFFQTCSGWLGSTQYAVIRETMAPQVLEDIVNWLQDVTRL
ncbi:MAG: alpha/beta fold hydrolase [Muribaculaceae bacterium]|nr:alpha/beta fold hydrolase [Muribaculaceae bacterium]